MALLLLRILLSYFAAGFCTFDVQGNVVVDFSPYNETWESFKGQYGRNYTADEEAIRFNTFVERLQMIESHNRDYLANRTSYYMDVSQFTDEIGETISCGTSSEEGTENGYENGQSGFKFQPFKRPAAANYNLPKSLDWRHYNAVTPVQDQGNCGSCYAFGVTASLEAQVKFATNWLIPLSQQQLVDCLVNGCDGSTAHIAFSYVYTAKGLKTASQYPYTYRTRELGLPGPTCRFKNEEALAQVSGVQVTVNETYLQYIVASQGPAYIRFRVQDDFQHYRGGVYSNLACTGPTNHAMTVIGYDYDVWLGKPYWIVKNSWGTDWGVNGFVLIERGRGICGIGSYGAVPVYQRHNRGMDQLNVVGSTDGCASPSSTAASTESTWPCFLVLLVVGVKYG